MLLDAIISLMTSGISAALAELIEYVIHIKDKSGRWIFVFLSILWLLPYIIFVSFCDLSGIYGLLPGVGEAASQLSGSLPE